MGNTHESQSAAASPLETLAVHPVESPFYRLADLKQSRGGLLLDLYHRSGIQAVEDFAKSSLGPFMYRNGEGTEIPAPDSEVDLGGEEGSRSTPDPGGKKKKACWKLESRGLLGESLIHVLLLANTPTHTAIAISLLRLYPALAWDVVEGPHYHGTGVIHLAAAFHLFQVAKLALEAGADVHQRATGTFYQPSHPCAPQRCGYQGICYLGERPLAWAACCENEAVYNILLSYGADPNRTDSYGNTVLHLVVIRDKLSMYGYALRHPQRPADDAVTNHAGLTPLTLACKLGRKEIFQEMLELSALEFWRYSNITCSAYPLNALDSIRPDGKTNWNSAMMIILNGRTTDHLDMVDGGVIQRLLQEKWKTFARAHFLRKLGLMALQLASLGTAVYLRPDFSGPLMGPIGLRTGVRYGAEILVCANAVSFVILQQGAELRAQGLSGFLANLVSNPAKVVYLASNILVFGCVPCRILGWRWCEDILLALAVPGCWFYLLFFAGATRLTGPFISMIYKMLVGDLTRFSIIYLVVLAGFSQAFYFLLKTNEGEDQSGVPGWKSFSHTWMSLFHMTLGEYDYSQVNTAHYAMPARLVFAAFMVCTPILLMNILVATMANTYCHIITQGEKEWARQWAKITLALERSLDPDSARRHLQTYSIALDSPNQSHEGAQRRAVIVIRAKSKSKARQRKEALTNWKRISNKVRFALRHSGNSAEVVRERLSSWARVEENPQTEGTLSNTLSQLAFAHELPLTAAAADPTKKLSPPESSGPNDGPPSSTKVPGNDAQDVPEDGSLKAERADSGRGRTSPPDGRKTPPRHRAMLPPLPAASKRHRDNCRKKKKLRKITPGDLEEPHRRLTSWSIKEVRPLSKMVHWEDS